MYNEIQNEKEKRSKPKQWLLQMRVRIEIANIMMVDGNQKFLIFGEPFWMESCIGGGGGAVSGENWSEIGEIPEDSGAKPTDWGEAETPSPADINEARLISTKHYRIHRNRFRFLTLTVEKRRCKLDTLKRRKLRRLCTADQNPLRFDGEINRFDWV